MSAFAYASKNFPPLIIILLSFTSFIADMTDKGYEKSSFNTDNSLFSLLVIKKVTDNLRKLYGTIELTNFSSLL